MRTTVACATSTRSSHGLERVEVAHATVVLISVNPSAQRHEESCTREEVQVHPIQVNPDRQRVAIDPQGHRVACPLDDERHVLVKTVAESEGEGVVDEGKDGRRKENTQERQ